MADTSASSGTNPTAAPASAPDRTAGGVVGDFFKATRGKLIGAAATVVVAFVIASATDVLGWIGDQASRARNALIAPVVEATLDAQLANEQSALRTAMRDAIDARINANAGSVVAGSFRLSQDKPRFTIPFYLPKNHVVELSLSIKGLRQGEVIHITSRNPLIEASTISENGNYEIPSIRQLTDEESPERAAIRGVMEVNPVQGRAAHFFPIHLNLSISQGEVANSETELKSLVTGEFVGILTPPIRHVGND